MDWKEEFVAILARKEENALQKALCMKRPNLPRFLYRYRPLASQRNFDNVLSEIKEAKIYLANPKDFNDPFEGCSILRKEDIKGSEELKIAYIKMFNEFIPNEILSNVFEKDNWIELFNSYMAERINEIDGVPIEDARKQVEVMSWRAFEAINKKINETIQCYVRIACFTESHINLPMWNHYADSHQGICLEYDLTSINDKYIVDRMFPVLYKFALPNGVETYLNRTVNVNNLAEYMLVHKLKDWEYEKEWRLILSLYNWHFTEESISPKDLECGKILDFVKPSKIYMGYRIGKACEELIRSVGEECNIEVYKMEKTEYGLRPGC